MRGVTAGRPMMCLGVCVDVGGSPPPLRTSPGLPRTIRSSLAGARPAGRGGVVASPTATGVVPTSRQPSDSGAFGRATESTPRDPVLVGAGDIGSCTLRKAAATAALIAATPGTVFTAGDNAYERGTADEFRRCYDPSWGQFRDRTRPTPGNHDYETLGCRLLRLLRLAGRQAGTPVVRLRPGCLAHLCPEFELRGDRSLRTRRSASGFVVAGKSDSCSGQVVIIIDDVNPGMTRAGRRRHRRPRARCARAPGHDVPGRRGSCPRIVGFLFGALGGLGLALALEQFGILDPTSFIGLVIADRRRGPAA